MLNRKRKGSILLPLVFAMTTLMLCTSLFQQTMSLKQYSDTNSHRYANATSYRAAVELATYQFVTDLESMSMTKDTSTEWLSYTDAQKFNEALDTLVSYSIDAQNRWVAADVGNVLMGCGVTDVEVVTKLTGMVSGAEFYLELLDVPSLDWSNAENIINDSQSKVYLRDVEVHAYLKQKGAVIDENFIVRGLYLEYSMDGAIATARISENLEGVEILREVN